MKKEEDREVRALWCLLKYSIKEPVVPAAAPAATPMSVAENAKE